MTFRVCYSVVAMLSLSIGAAHAQSADVFAALTSGSQAALVNALEHVSDLEKVNAAGDTAVLVAARAGDLDALLALVQAGANVNAMDRKRRDVLNIAITTQNPALAELALSLGADPTMVTSVYDGAAIIYGSAKGAVEIVRMLTQAGAPVNRVNNLGWTALLEVAILGDGSKDYRDIAAMLIASGADPAIRDRDGRTAFDHAQAKGHAALARILSVQ